MDALGARHHTLIWGHLWESGMLRLPTFGQAKGVPLPASVDRIVAIFYKQTSYDTGPPEDSREIIGRPASGCHFDTT
jgi:hypothetical protein